MAVILFVFALFLPSLLATETEESVTLVLPLPSESSTDSHKYYSSAAQAAAERILTSSSEDDVSLAKKDYELANISDVILAMRVLLRGADEKRNCVDEKELNEIRGKIQEAIKKCASGDPHNEKSEFETKEDIIEKIHEIDEKIKQNDEICTSLRGDWPEACKQRETELLAELTKIVSNNSEKNDDDIDLNTVKIDTGLLSSY